MVLVLVLLLLLRGRGRREGCFCFRKNEIESGLAPSDRGRRLLTLLRLVRRRIGGWGHDIGAAARWKLPGRLLLTLVELLLLFLMLL